MVLFKIHTAIRSKLWSTSECVLKAAVQIKLLLLLTGKQCKLSHRGFYVLTKLVNFNYRVIKNDNTSLVGGFETTTFLNGYSHLLVSKAGVALTSHTDLKTTLTVVYLHFVSKHIQPKQLPCHAYFFLLHIICPWFLQIRQINLCLVTICISWPWRLTLRGARVSFPGKLQTYFCTVAAH